MTPVRIGIVSYGMGNIGSVAVALRGLGAEVIASGHPGELSGADGLVLPGVGAFGPAIRNLEASGLADLLEEEVLFKEKPFLGICLGMQLLARDSEEGGFHRGLGWIDGRIRRLVPAPGHAVPHVGWNQVDFRAGDPLFRRIEEAGHFYFDHSFHLECDPGIVIAGTDHGGRVTAAVRQGNLLATQFHPEKSQRNGLKLLRNFLNDVEADRDRRAAGNAELERRSSRDEGIGTYQEEVPAWR